MERLLVLALIAIAANPAFGRCGKMPATGAAAAQARDLIATLNCAASQRSASGSSLLVDRFQVAANTGVTRAYHAVAFAVIAETVGGNLRNAVAAPNSKTSAIGLVQCSLDVSDTSVLGTCLAGPGTVYAVYRK